MSDAPALREDAQSETVGGVLGAVQRFAMWAGAGGWMRIVLIECAIDGWRV